MDRNDALVAVYDAATEVESVLYRTMLEEAGIDVVERQLEAYWLESVKQRALHSQLLVRLADAERARELVEAFRAKAEAGELLPPDEPPADEQA